MITLKNATGGLIKLNMITNDALKYLLQGYKDDLHHYETKIGQYKIYSKNAKNNIFEI